MPPPEFVPFKKIPRYAREVVVTEKIDGTNAQVYVSDDGSEVFAGSRNKWLTPGKTTDNYAFAAWVEANATELKKLGPGAHFGEWWGAGIGRKYGQTSKHFSLFNVDRWGEAVARPAPCGIVPLLWRGNFEEMPLGDILESLRSKGSVAAPGFMQPEGVVIYHVAGGYLFKKLLEGDELPKGKVPYGETRVECPV